jgi:acetate kinase
MRILVINSGSSSIKYKLYDMSTRTELAAGLLERIGETEGTVTHRVQGETFEESRPLADHDAGLRRILDLLTSAGNPPPLGPSAQIEAVGHRVVHGGEEFAASVVVDDDVLATIERCTPLAPLHNPANLAGLRATMDLLPDRPQVAVFDTAFFQTMPSPSWLYALPYEWYEKHRIRRYGFHGTSHRFVSARAAELLGKSRPDLISLHLGNGCSATCIRGGVAIDQSMGLTPLEGLVMGTRSGDVDPAIVFHLVREGMALDEVRTAMEKRSGLLGISGVSRDLRDVEQAAASGHERARLALEVFAHRARKYVGAFLAELGTCDALILTGGIGENADTMRHRILQGLGPLGFRLDPERNAGPKRLPERISTDDSPTAIWVIPTNEELLIAEDTMALVQPGT